MRGCGKTYFEILPEPVVERWFESPSRKKLGSEKEEMINAA
jgi:hypothetical protein